MSVKTTFESLRPHLNKLSLFFIVLLAIISGFLLSAAFQSPNLAAKAKKSYQLGNFPIITPTIKYGFAIDTFELIEGSIQANQFLSQILTKHHIDLASIDALAKNTRDVFDVRNLKVGNDYTILSKDTSKAADYFIYEPNVYKYVIYDLKQNSAEIFERPIETKRVTASGIIESSLWNAMVDNGLSFDVATKMEDAFAWSIDFHHIQKNDKFKMIYDQNYIDGKPVGIGKIHAAYFKNYDNEYHAIHFENERHKGFYDLEARSMKKAFLKAPVKYSRISSRYNLRRYHPVLKRRRPHYGTDYAAPRGTPIYAVADGVITKSSYTSGNGNYVKIKHDENIQTQYLHMSKRGKGIRPGIHVKQGQVIGYVGSTGLATGPHVCFRFWKNGKQVNHLRENLPPPDPMPDSDIPKFNIVKDQMKTELDEIPYKKLPDEISSTKKEANSNVSDS